MKIKSEDLEIIKALEDDEPGKWLEGKDLKYLDLADGKISLKDNDVYYLKEDPELILRILRLSGEIIVEIDDKTLETMKEQISLLKSVPRNNIRDHFIGIITSNDAQSALRFARDINAIYYFYGDSAFRAASNRAHADIDTVIDNINMARPEIEHRMTLLLRPLGKDTALHTLNHLIYSKEQGTKIVQAIKFVDKLYFLNTKMELKKFIKKHGYDNYIFIDKIARQEKKIYDRRDTKVESRHYMLQEAEIYKEPLSVDQLALDADKLIQEGIVKNSEQAEEMLDMLLDTTFIKPRLNTEENLIKKAKQLKRNPIAKHTRKVWWRR